MILEINSFEKYDSFINVISKDIRYSDPHLLYDKENLYSALEKENQKAYIVLEDNILKGLFVWLILPNEKYIEMIIGLSKEEKAIEEMLLFIEERYINYQVDFVINPKHNIFKTILHRKNALFDTEQQKMIWCKDVILDNNKDIEILSDKYELQYRNIHIDNVYWTAERILNAKDKFIVFVAVKNETVIGYVDVTYCYKENEPYYLFVKDEFLHQGFEQALLNEAIKYNKPNGMMVLLDIDALDEIKIFEDVGFEKVEGQNSLYATFKIK